MENSAIEWTDHTFNPWWGCMKVSEGCKNCYAATLDNRYHQNNSHWGPGSSRKQQSNKYWNEPLKWNKAAEMADKQAMVFCASMADVFEVSEDPVVLEGRARLFKMIEDTPHLIWQLLTKRPENILPSIPMNWRFHGIPSNVWLGTSVENQDAANERIPHLLKIEVSVRFLSCEPLLGPVDLSEFISLTENNSGSEFFEQYGWGYDDWSGGFTGAGEHDSCYAPRSGIHWIIAGGESGHGARPMIADWPRSILEQCVNAEIPFFFKQWGEYCDFDNLPLDIRASIFQGTSKHPIENFMQGDITHTLHKVGKKAAGSILDSIPYKNFPKSEDDE